MNADLNAGNAESWEWVRNWLVHPENMLGWRDMMLPVIDAAIAAGWNRYFRAGPSMEGLLFSTAEVHGQPSYNNRFPFVTLGVDNSGLFIGWSEIKTGHAPTQKEHVNAESAARVLKRHFADLWKLTKEGQEIPGVLA